MFKSFGIKARLMMSFVSISMLLLLVGAISYFAFTKMSQNYGHITSINMPRMLQASAMRAAQKDIVIAVMPLLERVEGKEELAERTSMFEAGIKHFDDIAKQYTALPFAPGGEVLFNELKSTWTPFVELSGKLLHLSASQDKADLALRDKLGKTELAVLRKNFVQSISKLIEFQEAEAKKWQASAESVNESATWALAISMIVGFILALTIGFVLSQSLSSILTDIANQLSEGSGQVSSAARLIASSSEELSAAVTEQAASLEQTSASIEQINAMISKNAENAKHSAASSQQARENVDSGKSAIQGVSKAIGLIQEGNAQISKQTDTSNREFAEIVQVIAEIGNKTKIINEIVFQTKLLSFNASVEAARAGEHGKGFAVVAEEVGNLAQMSGNAAKEISDMLSASIQRVEGIVSKSKSELDHLIKSGKAQVEEGGHVVQKCETLFGHIVKSVGEVDQMANEIASASQEQTQGVQEVTRAIAQLSQVNGQNATSSGQAASAAEQLAAQSQAMASLVVRLVQTVRGSAAQGISASTNVSEAPAHRARAASKKVVSIDHARRGSPAQVSTKSFKKAAGAEEIPSENDSRFEDM